MDTVLYPTRTNKARNHHKANTVIKRVRVLKVIEAAYIRDYELRLRFSDNTERIVDFGPFLAQSTNPLIRLYLDSDKFQEFRITGGDLEWNDFDLVFPIIDLYNDELIHSHSKRIRAAKGAQKKSKRTILPTGNGSRPIAKTRKA
jgi:Protein of unknown function (DUF2442)